MAKIKPQPVAVVKEKLQLIVENSSTLRERIGATALPSRRTQTPPEIPGGVERKTDFLSGLSLFLFIPALLFDESVQIRRGRKGGR